jgi:DNA-binding protein Fis
MLQKIGNSQHVLNAIFQQFPTIHLVETMLVEEAMALSKGNKSTAAKMLGVSRPTLHKKLELMADRVFEEAL